MDSLVYPAGTEEVSAHLGVPARTLTYLMHVGHLRRPRMVAGTYLWSDGDVERARVAFATRRRRGRPKRKGVQP
jgi:hypothetical protein